jgi:hypothetical protein
VERSEDSVKRKGLPDFWGFILSSKPREGMKSR